ncbi:MAG: TetR/AcrR family transcriptional regulator [Cumulibacter sp.]
MAQRKATTPEAVLEAAARVFQRKGYDVATLDDIAAEAGISKPTVYRYAKSKQWMLERIMKMVQAEMSERAKAMAHDGMTGLELLRAQVLVTVETGMEFKSYYQVAMVQARASSPRAEKEFRDWVREVTLRDQWILERAIEEGSLDLPGDPRIYGKLFAGMLASIHRWIDQDGELTAAEVTEHVLQLLSAAPREVIATDGPQPTAPRPVAPRKAAPKKRA